MDVLRPPDWMPNDYGLDRALVEITQIKHD